MKSTCHWATALGLALGLATDLQAANRRTRAEQKQEELAAAVQAAVDQFQRADPDLQRLFEQSAGYVVFPRIAKGAAGVGGAHGAGQVFEKGGVIGEARMTQVTIGFQLGGQVYSEVIFFETPARLKDFKDERVEFSAQVSAVAAAEGASRNAKYDHGVLIFTLAGKGLMYEASVGGQKFNYRPYPKR